MWVRKIFLDRAVDGDFHNLFANLRTGDTALFYNFVRMSPQQFDFLESLVRPLIEVQQTPLRESLSSAERLAITLSVDSTTGVKLHRFPLDFHRCRAWVQFCRNVSLEKKAPSQLRELRICSRHFEPSVYLTSGRLRHDALPTRASIADTSSECSSDMNCSQSLSETSASVRRAGEPAAVSGEPVSKGYVQSRSSQSLLLFQEDADGARPTGSTLNQACSHASDFIMVQSDHTCRTKH
ncbi:hypothetical protein V5799_030869 [Amblyomma americanum]|uniref:THAP-type domain-containing protein n=1 Tax=Amblyomma americanum TaxID=6943 RepID=A0AAQ4ELW0_AMBAM